MRFRIRRMFNGLSARLALGYLVVILVGMGIAAPLAWLAVENLYLETQSANLQAQAELMAAALGNETSVAGLPAGAYSQAANTLPGIHTRIIDAQGAVLIDLVAPSIVSGAVPLAMPVLAQNATGQVTPDELVSRPEIARALTGQSATAVRRVEISGGKRVLYAAAPLLAEDGRVARIIYLATPLPNTGWQALPPVIRWRFMGAILAAILLAGATGLLLARRISRPLGKLAVSAQAVAAGDLGQPAPDDSAITELAVLGHAFNTMLANLRQADQLKTAFISDVTHELRTPLTIIKGTIETLQDGAIDDLEARQPFLASMDRETERLIRLVNDLLVLTRADAGALNLKPISLDLPELVRMRCDHFEHIAGQRQVHLVVDCEPQPGSPAPYRVLADPDRIAQVLDNLLDNALRYSPPGTGVTVSVSRHAGQVECRVTDHGPGIAARHLPLIFERFYRADPARDRSEGGNGLGLAIVRGLVEAHGGRVHASSEAGQGACIAFVLPAAPG
jgi:two-component system sensor histidine kinase BaeS